MVFNAVFTRVSNQDNFFHTSSNTFVYYILDKRLINNWQHLFRDGLGCRQHTCSQTSYRNNRFLYLTHIRVLLLKILNR